VTFGARDATVSFGEVVALDGVSVDVRPGSVVALVGGDGAGKTTLLRALVREIALDSGEVRAPDKQRLGYLTASSGSWGSLTAIENLEFVGGIYGLTGSGLATRRDELLDAAGLAAAADRPASQLSGGMRRKLGFCLAIVHAPELLVLDEPSTGVDPVSRIDLWRLIAAAAADGTAVIMSTTYLDEAERAARLLVMDAGRVLTAGSYDQVRGDFVGAVTSGDPSRPEWSWRRGRDRHEYWPDGDAPSHLHVVEPDLEDIAIALALARSNTSDVTP
jgi:ABC-2 type transport system ATP-binding protein